MAEPTVAKSQPPLPQKRALQRCPNCEVRCDVSLFVDGALARCGHCGVRFEVLREKTPPPRVQAVAEAQTPQPAAGAVPGPAVLQGAATDSAGGNDPVLRWPPHP